MKNKHIVIFTTVILVALGAAYFLTKKPSIAGETRMSTVTTPSGLKYTVLTQPTEPTKKPVRGQLANVHYTGWLTLPNSDEPDLNNKFDSSVDRGQAFRFPVGMGHVIRGWDEGVLSMAIGEKRRFTIPANLAYGPQGIPGVIPQNATLVFDVELLSIK